MCLRPGEFVVYLRRVVAITTATTMAMRTSRHSAPPANKMNLGKMATSTRGPFLHASQLGRYSASSLDY